MRARPLQAVKGEGQEERLIGAGADRGYHSHGNALAGFRMLTRACFPSDPPSQFTEGQ